MISQTLQAGARAPAEARALIDALPLDLTAEQRYEIRIALSELVANGVRHGSQRTGDTIDLRITVATACFRCEVADHGPGFAVGDRERAVPDAPGGLGLILVDRLAARWGTERAGRTVWFEFDLAA